MKIVFIGLYLEGAGFTRVLSALVNQLRHEILYLGLHSRPPQQPPRFALKTLPPQTPWASVSGELQRTMESFAPDVVFLHQPPWKAARLVAWLRAKYPTTKLALYTPLEGRLKDIDRVKAISEVDLCLAYTKYARQQFQLAAEELTRQDPGFCPNPIGSLPHGVDTQSFYPLSHLEDKQRRSLARQLLFPNQPELQNAFIVLNANRNYPRKRIDLTLDGFAEFAKGKPENVYLYLHQPFTNKYDLHRLSKDISKHNLTERVLVNLVPADNTILSDEQLNWLYNACDVGITTSMGEGWGLTSFEHAATGAAQIVPEHTVFIENWRGAALMLPIVDTTYMFYEYTEMYVISAMDVAHYLAALYQDPTLHHEMAFAAYQRATAPEYQWEAIAQRLSERLCALVNQN